MTTVMVRCVKCGEVYAWRGPHKCALATSVPSDGVQSRGVAVSVPKTVPVSDKYKRWRAVYARRVAAEIATNEKFVTMQRVRDEMDDAGVTIDDGAWLLEVFARGGAFEKMRGGGYRLVSGLTLDDMPKPEFPPPPAHAAPVAVLDENGEEVLPDGWR